MATEGELAAARLVERLLQLENEFENLVDTVKTEYRQWWQQMSQPEMNEFIELLGLTDQKALREFIITRGAETRARIFPQWMLDD
jgi:hypothetical protein